jgi:hypothetical protein
MWIFSRAGSVLVSGREQRPLLPKVTVSDREQSLSMPELSLSILTRPESSYFGLPVRPGYSFLAEFAKAPDLRGPCQSRFRILIALPHIIHVQRTQ